MPAASLDVGPDGQVGVVWTSAHEDELRDVYFAESLDRGASYGTNHRVTETSDGIQEEPDVTYDGAVVHVLWIDARPYDWDYDILHAASGDAGHTFSAPERVNDDPEEESHGQQEVSVARRASGGPVAVWLDRRELGDDNVYFAGPAVMAAPERERPLEGRDEWAGAKPVRLRAWPIPASSGAWVRAPAGIDQVSVLTADGRFVRRLLGQEIGIETRFCWDGRDGAGRRAGSGIYYLQVGNRDAAPGSAGGRLLRILLVE